MTRLTLAFGACVLVLGAGVAAWANHVPEPAAPIVAFSYSIENYADNFPTDCQGSALHPKVRLQPIATMDQAAWQNGEASEPFSVAVRIFRRVITSKGQVTWPLEEAYVWGHQSVPPHNATSRYNTAYALTEPGQPNGGSSSVLAPGYYRSEASLLTDNTGVYFEHICEFTIQAA